MTSGLGVHLARFDTPPHSNLFTHAAAVARTAEREGFDAIYVMDHFQQVPAAGGPAGAMPEAYTLLAALAAVTTTIEVGTLVTGVTYRNPALLAKTVTTLDIVSAGRAVLGVGAAWLDSEHRAYGFEFPSTRERMQLLEDTIEICRAMFMASPTTLTGACLGVIDAWNDPPPVRPGGPPIMVGGTGERHTLRIAATLADRVNINSPFGDLPHKLDVLAVHLDTAERSRSQIAVSTLALVVPGTTMEDAESKLRRLISGRGLDPASLDDADTRARITERMLVGGPDELADQAGALMRLGVDGIVVNFPCGTDAESLAIAAGAIGPVVRRAH